MRLILVRHGETNENKNKVVQGFLNTTLSKIGIQQAKKVANRLKDEKIDFAYSSDLDRAKQTAKEILKFHPETKLILKKELREQNKGIYEGKQSINLHKDIMKSKRPFNQFKPKEGESMIELGKRSIKFYNKLVENHLRKTVLIISHGGTIRSLLMALNKETESNYKKYIHGNTAITILEVSDDKKHKIKLLSCIKHLEEQYISDFKEDIKKYY